MDGLKTLRWFGVCLAIAVAAAPSFADENEDESAEAEELLTVEEILTRDPDRDEYVEDDICIHAGRIKDVQVIDKRHVAFRMRQNKYYLVQFKNDCPDLNRNRPVYLERHTSRLCKQDRIWGVRETGLGGFERGISCYIPGFQSVTKEQVVMLKDALARERRKARNKSKRDRRS